MTDRVSDDRVAGLKNARELVVQLVQNDELSLAITVNDVFTKMLLLSAASYCESRTIDILIKLYEDRCGGGKTALAEFVKSQALNRKYYQLFDWDARNTNRFFGMFGSGFREYMQAKLENNSEYKDRVKAFLELGKMRNEIVHENLATFNLGKNADEIFSLYRDSQLFLDMIDTEIRLYISSGS